jgi:hypothetical protein
MATAAASTPRYRETDDNVRPAHVVPYTHAAVCGVWRISDIVSTVRRVSGFCNFTTIQSAAIVYAYFMCLRGM